MSLLLFCFRIRSTVVCCLKQIVLWSGVFYQECFLKPWRNSLIKFVFHEKKSYSNKIKIFSTLTKALETFVCFEGSWIIKSIDH